MSWLLTFTPLTGYKIEKVAYMDFFVYKSHILAILFSLRYGCSVTTFGITVGFKRMCIIAKSY